jgi:HPt (histidine-containing phosphotransfer) domain-containing protein
MRSESGHVDTTTYLSVCRNGDAVDVALMTELLGYFVDGNSRRMDAASEAVEAGDRVLLRDVVHAVRGSAALVGAGYLHDLATALELETPQGTIEDLRRRVEALTEEFAAVLATLRARHPEAWSE